MCISNDWFSVFLAMFSVFLSMFSYSFAITSMSSRKALSCMSGAPCKFSFSAVFSCY